MIIGTSRTRSKHKQRSTLRIPILHDATFRYWTQSLSIFDQHTLQQVSHKWQINATTGEGTELFYGSLHITRKMLAAPKLFDESALLRCLNLAGPYLHHLRLVGLPSLVLPRRSQFATHMKDGTKIVECSILYCDQVNAHDQLGWLKSLPNLRTLNLAGCLVTETELKSLKQQLPDTVVLDLVQCGDGGENGCSIICGSDTICRCNLESENWADVHIQSQEGLNDTPFCNDCAETNLCSRCCTHFCNANEKSLECIECNTLLCQTCNMEDQERVLNGQKRRSDRWGCDDQHGKCDLNDLNDHQDGYLNEFHMVSTHFHSSICSSCAIKCKSCDAMLCADSSNSWMHRYGEQNSETPCNKLRTCQYCAKECCNNCAVKDDDVSKYELLNIGRCENPNTDWCQCCGGSPSNCNSFTCSSCMDQMIECDGCDETRCGVCLERDQMIDCDGCDRKYCSGRSQYPEDDEKEECRMEECCTCKKSFCYSCRTEQNWNERRDEIDWDARWDNICCEDCVEK